MAATQRRSRFAGLGGVPEENLVGLGPGSLCGWVWVLPDLKGQTKVLGFGSADEKDVNWGRGEAESEAR